MPSMHSVYLAQSLDTESKEPSTHVAAVEVDAAVDSTVVVV